MSDPFIGEIRAVAFNFAPYGWHLCDGSILQVAQNEALFALLGNTYGGTYPNTFAIPDLRGRSIIGVGAGPNLPNIAAGELTGAASVQLTLSNLPSHNHPTQVADNGHNHIVGIPAHTHNFTLPQHSHSVSVPLSNSSDIASGVVAIDTGSLDGTSSGSMTAFASGISDNGVTGVTGVPNSNPPTATSTSTTGISVLTGFVGSNADVPTQSPVSALYYIIALEGIFPPRC